MVREHGITQLAQLLSSDESGGAQDEAIVSNRFAVMADLHFGSKESQVTRLQQFVKRVLAEGIKNVLVVGDVFTGSAVYRGHSRDVYAHGPQEQVEVAERHLPHGPVYHILGGNHDYSHVQRHNVDAVRLLCRLREDCRYVGQDEATVDLGDDNLLRTRLWHPSGGLTMSTTYRAEKYIREQVLPYYHEKRIDIVFVGHLHTMALLHVGKVVGVMCGSFESTTGYLRRMGKVSTVGGWIFEIARGNNNEVELMPRMIRYEPIDNDWINYL